MSPLLLAIDNLLNIMDKRCAAYEWDASVKFFSSTLTMIERTLKYVCLMQLKENYFELLNNKSEFQGT